MIKTLTERVIRHEGLRLSKYQDQFGNWTIGVGHKITPADGDTYDTPITEEQARELLETDLNIAQAGVNDNLPWTSSLSQVRQEVLVELAFWIGIVGLLAFKNMLAYLKSGDYDSAAQQLLSSKLHHEVPGRTEELEQLLRSGVSSSL